VFTESENPNGLIKIIHDIITDMNGTPFRNDRKYREIIRDIEDAEEETDAICWTVKQIKDVYGKVTSDFISVEYYNQGSKYTAAYTRNETLCETAGGVKLMFFRSNGLSYKQIDDIVLGHFIKEMNPIN
jgi:hypothetical protein